MTHECNTSSRGSAILDHARVPFFPLFVARPPFFVHFARALRAISPLLTLPVVLPVEERRWRIPHIVAIVAMAPRTAPLEWHTQATRALDLKDEGGVPVCAEFRKALRSGFASCDALRQMSSTLDVFLASTFSATNALLLLSRQRWLPCGVPQSQQGILFLPVRHHLQIATKCLSFRCPSKPLPFPLFA